MSQAYPPESGGGIATQTRAKAHGLAERGHDVLVVAHGRERRRESREGRVRVIRIAAPDERLPIRSEAARWMAHSVDVAAEIARLESERPLDLVEFPEWGAEGFLHLLDRRPASRPAAVIQLHGPLVMLAHTIGWPEIDSDLYRVGRFMEETCLRLADAVYSSSACSSEWCVRHYGLDPCPVLHTGVDTRVFAPDDDGGDDRPTVVFVGKIVANKGDGDLLEACLRIAPRVPGLRLRMLGSGDPARFRALTDRAAGHPGLLETPGHVERDRLPAELAGADVFAAPSRYEGGPGFVYLEAMACGVPVVACSGSGVEETVDADCGMLVPPGDIDALADALLRLLRDPDLRERLGRAGRKRALAMDSEACVDRIEAYYESVLERGHP